MIIFHSDVSSLEWIFGIMRISDPQITERHEYYMYDIRHRQASKLIEIRDEAGELMRNTPVIVKQTGF